MPLIHCSIAFLIVSVSFSQTKMWMSWLGIGTNHQKHSNSIRVYFFQISISLTWRTSNIFFLCVSFFYHRHCVWMSNDHQIVWCAHKTDLHKRPEPFSYECMLFLFIVTLLFCAFESCYGRVDKIDDATKYKRRRHHSVYIVFSNVST